MKKFFSKKFWSELARDEKGNFGGHCGIGGALADRVNGDCGFPRLPDAKYLPWSRTESTTLDASGNGTITFTAERDLLIFQMSANIADAVPLSATISLTYCNTKYLINSSARRWTRCCTNKPCFRIGVKEDKKLVFTINGGTPAGAAAITLSGIQGRGCCG